MSEEGFLLLFRIVIPRIHIHIVSPHQRKHLLMNNKPDYGTLFESMPTLTLILSPDLHIIAATDTYLAATLTKREDLTGKYLFDTFPENPDDPSGKGMADLKASLNRVLQNKVTDIMGEIRYDIPIGDGTFETRYWTPSNTPVLDKDGKLMHIVNQVSDVTDLVRMREKGSEYEQLTQELKQRAENMEGEVFRKMQQLQAANEKMSIANEELRATKEELQVTNEELQATHEELRVQQEELTELNSELTMNNESLEKAGLALLLKAEELERSNGFKTDFLSNMSHELRTPLNSMLILSKLLATNTAKNLTPKQVEQASIIHKAGNDLLTLINDILDLSKIEAGKMEVVMEKNQLSGIAGNMEDMFSSIAAQKEIKFKVVTAANVPEHLLTDKFRLEQVLKNLLSNAFKFTDKGGAVTLSIDIAPPSVTFRQENLFAAGVERGTL